MVKQRSLFAVLGAMALALGATGCAPECKTPSDCTDAAPQGQQYACVEQQCVLEKVPACASGCGNGQVCDEAANDGLGACVQCLSDAQCGADAPVCDQSTNTCKTCLNGADGSMKGCRADQVCDGAANNGNGACVQCMSDAQCGGDTPVCDLSTSTCKTCLNGADGSIQGCLEGMTCNATANDGRGICEGCNSDAQCAAGTPTCKTGNPGVCVECLDDGQCNSVQPVCGTNNLCGCTNDSQCGGATPVCDTYGDNGQGQCVQCVTDAQCAGVEGRPFCGALTCDACRDNSDCAAQETCSAGTCEALTGLDEADEQIKTFLAAEAGPLAVPLTIHGAFVTAITPAEAVPQGFFVQALPAKWVTPEGELATLEDGYAMFVSPSASMRVAVGDRVSFTVRTKEKLNGDPVDKGKMDAATVITGFMRLSSGHPVRKPAAQGGLVEDVNPVDGTPGRDLVTHLDAYEGRLLRVSGTVTWPASNASAAGAPASSGFMIAQYTVPGTAKTGGTGPKLRVPNSLGTLLNTLYGVEVGCRVTVEVGPMWRFDQVSQNVPYPVPHISAYSLADISELDCSGSTSLKVVQKVLAAVPLSPTQLRVSFQWGVDPSTLDLANLATQFTVTPALRVTGATVSGKDVILSTAVQKYGTSYTVQVASTVKSLTRVPVSSTDNSAMFKGYREPAVLVINEVNPNRTNKRDLVELKVVRGGATEGMTLWEDFSSTSTTLMATLPDAEVETGDLIVIHFSPAAASGDAPISETASKTQYPKAAYSANYDSAWDFHPQTSRNLGFGDRVLRIKTLQGTLQDTVPFVDSSATSHSTSYASALQAIQAEGLWNPADCRDQPYTPVPCVDRPALPNVVSVSVDWVSLKTSDDTKSVFRYLDTDNDEKADWDSSGTPESFGLDNPAKP